MKKVKPFYGKYLPRGTANRINDAFLSAKKPDRTALKKEAEEYFNFMKLKNNN